MGSGLPSIQVEHLTYRFAARGRHQQPVIANDDLSFSVAQGECFGLLGTNGAGKTTLIRQLLGLMPPSAGRIWVEGIDVVAYPERVKSLIGFLPQSGIAMRAIEVERALHYTGRLRGQTDY